MAATPPPAIGRERKIATIVFADLVGFTGLNEASDPELVGALVSRAFDRLAAEVTRYEGLIEKFAGDAILALFGVPSVHEDDAERAVRAALEMQAAMGELGSELRAEGRPELALRVGVETGEVLVDLARAAGDRDRMVIGDAVNTAARLQQLANPGAIVVGPLTYAATRDVVDFDELPPAVLKGKELPVAAWRAVAVKARRGGRRAPLGLEAPLIGRDEEIALLKETVRRTVHDGRPHLVTVIGSAGVGKSRLTWELEKYLDGLPETYYWRKGRCLAYAQASFSAFADAVKVDARVLDDDAPLAAGAKLEGRLVELSGGSPDPALLDALRAVLAIGPPGQHSRDELFDAWRRYLELLARDNPLVLVQEDVHWADEGLLDFIDYVARWAEGPMLLLCLARHELLERRPTWGGGLPNAASIVLEPLDAGESARLVDAMLSGGLPSDLRDRIVGLAEGNPLFTEELVRMFVDRGVLRFADGRWELARPVDEVEVPGSVHAVLAARLDTLPAAEKRAAQDAAVVGRIFWDALIAHLSRQGGPATSELLRRLRVKELVVPREPSSLAGAAEFGFRHVLIRDVAYDSLPKRERATKHLDVARWAEETLADREEEMVELLASHYLAALHYEEEFAESGSARLADLRRRTYAYARRAGTRAESLANLEAATRWLRVAIEQAERLGLPVRERASLTEAYAEAASGYEANEALLAVTREALELLLAQGDRSADDEQLIGRLRAWLGTELFFDDRLEEARAVLREGIAGFEPGPPSPARAGLVARLGWTYWRAGPIDDAPAILRRAIDEARACGADRVERWALHDLGVAMSMLGRVAESLPLIEESRRLAIEAGDRLLLSRCAINLPAVMDGNGEPSERTVPILLEGIERARRSVNRDAVSWIAANLADVLEADGRLAEAMAYRDEAIAAAEALGDRQDLASRTIGRGWTMFLRGEREAAIRQVEAGLAIGAVTEPQAEIYPVIWDAWVRWPAHAREVVRALDDAVARRTTASFGIFIGGLWLARLALRIGDEAVLRRGIDAVMRGAEGCSGPIRAADRRWLAGLGLAPAEGAEAVAGAARDLAALSRLLPAADAFADAALLAAGAGLDATPFASEAERLYAACGAVPVLGPLPETEWLATGATPAAG